MALRHHIESWTTATYEPETPAFGGIIGMNAAHALFHADSTHILTSHAGALEPPLARREMSLLLLSTLLRGAHLEWYEQGDVWDQVCQDRPLPNNTPTRDPQRLHAAVRSLLTSDTGPNSTLCGPDGPLSAWITWFAAFGRAGCALAEANDNRQLHRGLREVLAYHVIWH
ncbi:thiopeptide-type bacteriocin biosynthesis protein [Streptomyces sp. NBC_00203]|uniref:thiopeptide-type bacteriocin biosynthesis protein n=1 Tax=Streptomyces sp. NBC_00203 TaxID=2975680 RepID=UPI00386BE929